MFFRFLKLTSLFILFLALVLPWPIVLAEENLEEICQMDNIELKEQELSKEEYQKYLEKCEAYYMEKSKEIEKDINKTEA